MSVLVAVLAALALAQPPAWIQRAVAGPYLTWRVADVLGTPVVEGIVVNRDSISHSITVNVVDSRLDPPRIVRIRELPGTQVRWLRAGRRDGLARSQIAVDVTSPLGETAYLLRVRRGLRLEVARKVRGHDLAPRTFSHY
ncbi:MAG: hypothetical protein ACM3QU_16155 [Verrucomicrobiota bacterium]